MQLRTFNTLGTALLESALDEDQRGNTAEGSHLTDLFTDLQLTELRFRRIRLKYFDYLDRRDGIRRKLRAAPKLRKSS
ncbi:MAG TPA: hypothetical protein VJQ82_04770 [Terriglobales bacterium]|nr:hypothetical protein [Terriglobales bacterium]